MLKGGVADKLGNAYEALWTLAEGLRVLRGEADEIRIEPFNEDAKGLEFRITTNGRNAWHQCKRRRNAGTWTLTALGTAGVLSDFARKLADSTNECVFASSDPAPTLKALVGKATIVDNFIAFAASLSRDDEMSLQQLLMAWPVSPETMLGWLKRTRVETVSDVSIRRELTGLCGLLFAAEPNAAIERLAGFLDQKVTHTLTTEIFRAAVDDLGLGWKARFDATLAEKLAQATDKYVRSLSPLVGGVEISTPDLVEVADMTLAAPHRITVVSGPAGSGKSVALARIVTAARESGWPVLALRVDWFLKARSVGEIGYNLVERCESPVALLGNWAGSRDALLVLDQLDAVSESSGRSGLIREFVFDMIEATRFYHNLRLVVACRTYDLENDGRLKDLQNDDAAVAVRLKPLDWESAVKPVLERLGLGGHLFSERQRQMLSVAVNLWLFVTLVRAGETIQGDLSGTQLFDRLLALRAREFLERGITWTPQGALGCLARWMSENQMLTAPTHVLSALPGAVDVLSSYGLIAQLGSEVQFAHESFFDHVFSSDFVSRGDSLLTLLRSDQQRLFRRTQVRQIFARLRTQGGRAYLVNLRDVLNSTDVRYLVKDAVAAWLASVDAPTSRELALVEELYNRGGPLRQLARTIVLGDAWLSLLIQSQFGTRLLQRGEESRRLAWWLLRKGASKHHEEITPFLRQWWGGREANTKELRAWFGGLYPDGSIGELEALYADVIAAVPIDAVDRTFDANFDLGSWVNKDREFGARVLGYWLIRWMGAFPNDHPFERDQGPHDRYWLKELAEHTPTAFLDAVWPAFVESLRRDREALIAGTIYYPTITVPSSDIDSSYVALIDEALRRVAQTSPVHVEGWLEQLPITSVPAAWLHLRAIAANGTALHRRLLPLLGHPDVLKLGEDGEWRPLAEAARAAFPHLGDAERRLIENHVMDRRPEYAQIAKSLQWARSQKTDWVGDIRAYAMRQLAQAGEVERATLGTIGEDQLGFNARSRLAELERKFDGQALRKVNGTRGGVVRPPIPLEKATFMSDAQWLGAMERYRGSERHTFERNGITGGGEQLAHVLQAQVKTQPDRFVNMLERLPATMNPIYVGSVLSGLRECDPDAISTDLLSRAFLASGRWDRGCFRRQISWLAEKHPAIGREPEILAFLLDVAASGDASDTTVRTTNPRSKTKVSELLIAGDDLESSGINGDRGAAWHALAQVLWKDNSTLDAISGFLESRIDAEPLTSVRMCMFQAINSITKHAAGRGLALMKRLAEHDLRALQSNGGRHVLRWAVHNHSYELGEVLQGLIVSESDSLRALGLIHLAGLALHDDVREAVFMDGCTHDVLRRRIAAFLSASSLSADRGGDRSSVWLTKFFQDADPAVRDEASHVNWGTVLDCSSDRTALAKAFLTSTAFDDHSNQLMRALETRIERFPDLTFDSIDRVLKLQETWTVDKQRANFTTFHHLGRTLVALYRAVEGDYDREERLLDLFDRYLATDLHDVRQEIGAYERH